MGLTKTSDLAPFIYKVRLLSSTTRSSAVRIRGSIQKFEYIDTADYAVISDSSGTAQGIEFYFQLKANVSTIAITPLEIAMAIREMEMKDLFNDFT